MARFEGTIQEYHDYIGPRIRNKVNNITRTARLSRNKICEHCGQEGELQSAHVHGFERRVIIERVLSLYKKDKVISCDLAMVEQQILEAHKPVNEIFLFLCQECHKKYDSDMKMKIKVIKKPKKGLVHHPMPDPSNHGFPKLDRIESWANKPYQINHKIIRAYLFLEKGGKVLLRNLNRTCSALDSKFYVGENFKGNYASMKTDAGHAHGKVFYDDDGVVFIYPVVRKEIRKWFGE